MIFIQYKKIIKNYLSSIVYIQKSKFCVQYLYNKHWYVFIHIFIFILYIYIYYIRNDIFQTLIKI